MREEEIDIMELIIDKMPEKTEEQTRIKFYMESHKSNCNYFLYEKYKKETKDNTPMVIVSTASPYKFTKDVMIALDQSNQKYDAFALMEKLQKASGVKIPASIQDIERRKVLHNNVCEKQNIKEFVVNYLLG